jgi:GrpB-like predicted nucleotidyltransferase (UPF0157 family)
MAQRKVEIGEYDPKWAVLYREEKAKIVAAIGHLAVAVEHIGSTAVVGLGAKPIIDIMVGVSRLSDAQLCMQPLESLGYRYQPEHEVTMPERRFFGKGEPPVEQHYHLHIVEKRGEFWRRHLAFRDYLRSHPETSRQYCELKRKLASKYGSDREGYTEAKTQFIESIVAKALCKCT